MGKIYRVFISSTYDDLIEERREVSQALLEMDCFPTGMELFQASDISQWELIKKVIDTCDYYIVIIAGRYGSVHNKTHKSYTQMEYEYALETKIPIMGFVHRDIASLPANKIDDIGRVKEFIEIVKQYEVRFWSTPHELAGVVSRSMHKMMMDNPRIGWIRDSEKSLTTDMLDVLNRILTGRSVDIHELKSQPLEFAENEDLLQMNSNHQLSYHSSASVRNIPPKRSNVDLVEKTLCDCISYTRCFYLDELKSSILKEITNIVLSNGVTAFSDFLDYRMDANPPSVCFYQSWNGLCDVFTKANVLYTIFELSGFGVDGAAIIEVGNEFLESLFLDHTKECVLKFSSDFEAKKYKKSIIDELGSVFSGNCATALYGMTQSRIRMIQASLESLKQSFRMSIPIFVGKLPFISETNICFNSYLLLNADSAKAILSIQDIL